MRSPRGDAGLGTVGSHCSIEQRRDVVERRPLAAGKKQRREVGMNILGSTQGEKSSTGFWRGYKQVGSFKKEFRK